MKFKAPGGENDAPFFEGRVAPTIICNCIESFSPLPSVLFIQTFFIYIWTQKYLFFTLCYDPMQLYLSFCFNIPHLVTGSFFIWLLYTLDASPLLVITILPSTFVQQFENSLSSSFKGIHE